MGVCSDQAHPGRWFASGEDTGGPIVLSSPVLALRDGEIERFSCQVPWGSWGITGIYIDGLSHYGTGANLHPALVD